MLCIVVRGTDKRGVFEFGNRAVEVLGYHAKAELTTELFIRFLNDHPLSGDANFIAVASSSCAANDLEMGDWEQDVSPKWWSGAASPTQACSKTASGIKQDLYMVGCAYDELGTAYMKCGHLGRADEMYRRALEIYEHLGHYEDTALALVEMALLYSRAGYTDEADKYWRRMHVLRRRADRTITPLVTSLDGRFRRHVGSLTVVEH